MRKHGRFLYQPVLPLGKDGKVITGCKAHRALVGQATAEGTVLLKNDGTLPLAPGAKVCLFGRGAGSGFLFGGGGSGRLSTTGRITLAEALSNAAAKGEISFFRPLVDFYSEFVDCEAEEMKALGGDTYRQWGCGLFHAEPHLPEALYEQAKAFGDTAVFCLPRLSSEHTKFGDRDPGPGGFALYEEEKALLDKLSRDFQRVVVILNVCGPIETAYFKENDGIGAVLYSMYGGHTAGQVLCDLLLGKTYPSGHLQDTLAAAIGDYPTTDTFCESRDYVSYTEDIFVGYRYFETFKPDAVVYPFGFGLGYTTFSVTVSSASLEKNTVKLDVCVKNTGNFPGKEVVQVYLTAPQGKLGKAAKVLCAFEKTRELAPGAEARLSLRFDIREFGSFDDLGKICKSAFLLEKGRYTVHVGTNVRDTQPCLDFTLADDLICRKCHSYMSPRQLPERLTADGTYEKLPQAEKQTHKPIRYRLKAQPEEKPLALIDALEQNKLDAFIAGLSDEELAELLYGHPMMCASDTNAIGLMPREKRDVRRIPNVPTADGPAGLRLYPDSGPNVTHLPCANLIAQSWNLKLCKRVAVIAALEVKENNVGIWLSPALNIHRSPLCGRNFEYFSEDPLISGLFAAATVKGIQEQNIAATVKHFCCNNKEVNRKGSDSRVSERALREIYLRGFEICIRKAKPWTVMTSYNLVNGEQSSTNWEAINGILRGEWKYDGLVMTDWWVNSDLKDEVYAGSDVKMPEKITLMWENADKGFDPVAELQSGAFDREVCYASVRRIFELMGKLD